MHYGLIKLNKTKTTETYITEHVETGQVRTYTLDTTQLRKLNVLERMRLVIARIAHCDTRNIRHIENRRVDGNWQTYWRIET